MTTSTQNNSQELPIVPKELKESVNKQQLDEANLTWAGKLFFASVAAYIASDVAQAMKLPIKLRGKPEQIQAVVDAIKQIMERIEDIDLLSKRAVLLYVRGITKLSSKQLSITLSSLKKHYKDIRKMEEFISA